MARRPASCLRLSETHLLWKMKDLACLAVFVILAKARIQYFQTLLDPGLRRGDALEGLFDTLL